MVDAASLINSLQLFPQIYTLISSLSTMRVEMDSKQYPGQDLTAADLMNFLQKFQHNMEINMEDTKKRIDDTNRIMNGRLDGIDTEVKKVNSRMDENEFNNLEVNKRMDERLTALEEEMKKSTELRRKSNNLREQEAILDFHPSCSNVMLNSKVVTGKKTGVKTYGKKVDDITKKILQEPAGTFRS